MKFVPLHVHSQYSLLDGLSKAPRIAERCKELGYNACAITDHGNISGSVAFMKALKDVCKCGHQKNQHLEGKKTCRQRGCKCEGYAKESIKPIIGCEFYLCEQDATIKAPINRKLSHLVVLAKNLQGWKSLIQATSLSNSPEFMYYKPRLTLDKFGSAIDTTNLVAFSGHPGSDLANVIFLDPKAAYNATTYEEAKLLVAPDWKQRVKKMLGRYREAFKNFYVEIQLIDEKSLPAAAIIAKILRYVSKEEGMPCIATPDSHYAAKHDALDQRVLLCSMMDTTFPKVKEATEKNEDVQLKGFFKSNRYHIPSVEEMEVLHTPEELANTVAVAESIEAYDVFSQPLFPKFDCPNNDADGYLKELCRKGWTSKIAGKIPKDKLQEYADRVKMELNVFREAGLAGYFLIVQDYCNYAKNDLGALMSPGRGSGAGSLVSYLLNITELDPIEYNLLFERFYNAGRNAPGRISFPDIDCDFPAYIKELIFEYCRKKYGEDKVCQMVTFHRLQGKAALKEVMRVHESCSHDEMNKITSCVPDEAEIADQLQVMREETGEASIIRWALENEADALREYCYIDKSGDLVGPYSKIFEQAIRLEGTKKTQSKHAGGVVISTQRLADICPMVYDNNTNLMIAGLEMGDLEAMGHLKFDILAVATLDKVMAIQKNVARGVQV